MRKGLESHGVDRGPDMNELLMGSSTLPIVNPAPQSHPSILHPHLRPFSNWENWKEDDKFPERIK